MDRINWVTASCFCVIARLSRLSMDECIEPELIHAGVREALAQVARRAREAGYSDDHASLVVYALAALVDEVAMAVGGPLRERWSTQSMQLLLFRENVAGERFFVHLERVRAEPAAIDVLRTYYVCLQLGFHGRYGLQGEETTLRVLADAVSEQLLGVLVIPECLVPRRLPSSTIDLQISSSRAYYFAGVVLLATMALYLGLSVQLYRELALVAASSERTESWR